MTPSTCSLVTPLVPIGRWPTGVDRPIVHRPGCWPVVGVPLRSHLEQRPPSTVCTMRQPLHMPQSIGSTFVTVGATTGAAAGSTPRARAMRWRALWDPRGRLRPGPLDLRSLDQPPPTIGRASRGERPTRRRRRDPQRRGDVASDGTPPRPRPLRRAGVRTARAAENEPISLVLPLPHRPLVGYRPVVEAAGGHREDAARSEPGVIVHGPSPPAASGEGSSATA